MKKISAIFMLFVLILLWHLAPSVLAQDGTALEIKEVPACFPKTDRAKMENERQRLIDLYKEFLNATGEFNSYCASQTSENPSYNNCMKKKDLLINKQRELLQAINEFNSKVGQCPCNIGYIENNDRCVQFNLGTANVRALEIKNANRKNNCQAMSRIYKEFSRAVGFDSKKLSYYAGKILVKGGVPYLVSSAPEYVVTFNDSGFKAIYQDSTDQVRHFSSYFVAGIYFAKGMLSKPDYIALLAEWRDMYQPADIALGNAAAALARQTAGSQHMMENLDVSISTQICN
jgi:hypothetical protein